MTSSEAFPLRADSARGKVSVIVPVYFNAGSLAPLAERLESVERRLTESGLDLELIFVDDGSLDASWSELLKIRQRRPETVLVQLSRNFGMPQAVKAGAAFVTGNCFVILAADLQDPPDLIPEMAHRWLAGASFVICVRRSRRDPLLSKMFSAIYYWLLRRLAIPDYPSGGYDLSLMDAAFIPHLRRSGKTSYTLVFLYWLGLKPDVILYDRAEREHGKSRWSLSKRLTASLDVLLGFTVVPIRMISLIGVIVAGASFAYGTFQVVRAIVGRTDVAGFASVVSLISFLVGLVIVMLGIIGEYLWRVFVEVNGRPGFVVARALLPQNAREVDRTPIHGRPASGIPTLNNTMTEVEPR